MESKKGFFRPINYKKYKGNPTNIVYRSGLELSMMKWLDKRSDVLSWSSETVIIPYICKTDNRKHRYFVDFLITTQQPDGSIKTFLVEVKPYKQTKEPKPGNKKRKNYIMECMTYTKNKCKWDSAEKYCKSRGWEFLIITERDIVNG